MCVSEHLKRRFLWSIIVLKRNVGFLRNYRYSDLFGIFWFESGNAIKTTDVQYGNICPIILKLLIVWDFCKFLTKVHKTQLFILDKTRTMSLYFVQIKINYGKRYQNSFKCWITRRDILTKNPRYRRVLVQFLLFLVLVSYR